MLLLKDQDPPNFWLYIDLRFHVIRMECCSTALEVLASVLMVIEVQVDCKIRAFELGRRFVPAIAVH